MKMTSSRKIELPTNFGITYLEAAKSQSGKLVSLLLDTFMRSISFLERLSLRTKLDEYLGIGLRSNSPICFATSVASSHVAACNIGSDKTLSIGKVSELSICSNMIDFESPISCFKFINTPSVVNSSLLVVGLVNGDLHVYKISDAGNKLVYRMKIPGNNFAVGITSGSDKSYRFQVVLSKGKCVLDFDTVAVVSGNVGDDLSTCAVIDLIHQTSVVDCDVLADESFLATVSADGRIVVTDMHSGNCCKFKTSLNGSFLRLFWDQSTGHLLVIDEKEGKMVDYSWSNGLVGVATRPNREILARGHAPENRQKVCLETNVNSKCIDFRKNILVTVVGDDLHVYKKSTTDRLYPISQLAPAFVHEKQTNIHSSRETIRGVAVLNHKKALLVSQPSEGPAGYRFRSIDI